jgi:hypothetical protein
MVGQTADAPADTPLRGCRAAPAAPAGMWLEWNPAGDAGGHDGTGRGRTIVGQLADAPADTPLSRLSQVCGWNGILRETPEVTTVRAAVGRWWVSLQMRRLTHRFRGCRTAPAAPTGACVHRDNAAVAQLQQPHRYVAGMESCGRRRRSRRQRWWVRQQMSQLTHRFSHRRTASAAPQVRGWNEILWETPEVTTVRVAVGRWWVS